MPVNFATPIAHQTGADYSAFNNALAVGRPFRQPLQTAPNPNNFVPGLELFLSGAGDIPVIYSWLDGLLRWQAASGAQTQNRLVLTTNPRLLAGNTNLPGLNLLEGLPVKVIYENFDQSAVQARHGSPAYVVRGKEGY